MHRKSVQFSITAEPDSRVLTRVLTAIFRRRMPLVSFWSSVQNPEGLLHLEFVVKEDPEQALKFRQHLDRQIDILSVTISNNN